MWLFANYATGPHKGLRKIVLNSLCQSPKNGVELMDDVEKMSFGFWRPSPGSIYPLLESLSREGLVEKAADGRYELTEKGSKETDGQFWPRLGGPATVDLMVAEMKVYVSYFEDLGKEKIAPFAEDLKNVSSRLSKLLKE